MSNELNRAKIYMNIALSHAVNASRLSIATREHYWAREDMEDSVQKAFEGVQKHIEANTVNKTTFWVSLACSVVCSVCATTLLLL